MTRSPYLRDRLADMPVFRDRDRPLPMSPDVHCNEATIALLPKHDRAKEVAERGLPRFFAGMPRPGDLTVYADDSIPDGVIEIDGTRITLAEMRAACEGP